MPVRIGKIELTSVQHVRADDNRSLVELKVPGQSGAVFQDLGRTPAAVILEGLLLGSSAESTLETLRSAYQKADVLSFASDIALGTEMTEVVIADLLVRQEAGYRDRYRYTIKVREHVEPPESPAAQAAAMDAQAAADGGAWSDDALAAGGVLADPSTLPAVVGANPGVLDHLSADQLGDAIGANSDLLNGNQFGAIVNTVGGLDPSKANGLLGNLKKGGFLSGLVEKMAAVGQVIMKGVRMVAGLLGSLGDVMELVNTCKEIGSHAKKLWDDIVAFRPWAPLETDGPLEGSTFKDLLHDVEALLGDLARLLGLEILKRIKQLAIDLGVGNLLDAAVSAVMSGIQKVEEKMEDLKKIFAGIQGIRLVLTLGEVLTDAVASVSDVVEENLADVQKALLYLQRGERLLETIPDGVDIEELRDKFKELRNSLGFYRVQA